jgi:hypothetical protein
MGPFIVLGPHRSGTSLVANVLHCLNVKMGDRFPRTNRWNSRGYWEDVDFIRLNVWILRKAGGKWSKPPDPHRILAAGEHYEQEIKSLLLAKEKRNRSVKGQRWGWKDPRTCLTIPAILPYLDNPHFIVVQRSRAEMIRSLMRRHRGSKWKKWAELTDTYQSRLDVFLKAVKTPVHYVRFDRLVSKRHANSEITKLGWFTGRTRFRQQRDRAMKEIDFR